MIKYYSRRAKEYDAMWRRDDPVRQAEQAAIAGALKRLLRGRRVLEIACGTGHWTQFAGEVAASVVATDASEEMLKLAVAKSLPPTVKLRRADAYHLSSTETFDAGLANFWFSHVPKERIVEFLRGFHSALQPGAIVFMADNMFVEGLGGELFRKANDPNTYKLRMLSDGSKHEVLKNYYDAEELRDIFAPLTGELHVRTGKCFWWLDYKLP